jgi:CRISPR-associated protein Csa3
MKESIVIATIYSYEPVIAGVVKLGASRLILLTDNNPSKEQDEAVQRVKKSLESYVKIESIKTSVYDIYQIAADVVELIDSFCKDAKIYLNVSAGRKTKSLGLMFAGYARSSRIEKIVYVTKENQEIVTLPNMPFSVTAKQRKVLSQFVGFKPEKLKEVYKSANISRATLFLMLKEFKRRGLMDLDNNLSVAGKIALL